MGTHSMGSSTKNQTKGRAPGNSKPIWNYKTKDLRPPPAGCLLVTPSILGLETKVKVNTRPRAAVGPSPKDKDKIKVKTRARAPGSPLTRSPLTLMSMRSLLDCAQIAEIKKANAGRRTLRF